MNQPLRNPVDAEPSAMPSPPVDVPPAPRTPSPKARRMIFRYQGTQKIMLIIGIVFTLVGVPTVGLFGAGTVGDIAIDAAGKTTKGVITEWRTMSNVTVNEEHPTEITFTYDADGKTVTGTCSTLDDGIEASLQREQAVDVEYSGSFARVAGTSFSVGGYFGLLAFIFPLVGVLMWFFAVRSNRREIAAFTHGTLAHGTITESGYDYSAEMNGRHPFKIVWEFTVDTNLYKGSLTSMDPTDLSAYVIGREVGVLYLPEKPSVNTLYID